MRGMVYRLFTAWRRATVVPVLLALARRDLRRGRTHSAKLRLRRCTRILPFCFRAHFVLGCVHLREGDLALARRELLVAQEIAPRRFLEYRTHLPELAGLVETGIAVGERGSVLGVPFWLPPERPRIRGDFVSVEEWLHFRRRGPITAEEVADLDWDEVIDSFSRG